MLGFAKIMAALMLLITSRTVSSLGTGELMDDELDVAEDSLEGSIEKEVAPMDTAG
jgi:hypothetical protein